MTPRYETTGTWFKGNTHIHSVASDGGKTFTELAAMYAGAGYDFLFRTDHWVASDAAHDDTPYPLLWLDGTELDGQDTTGAYYHVVCLGAAKDVARGNGLVAGMEAARAQGALLILAHPHWCGNTTDDCTRWGFDGVEVYNHVCHWLNGKSGGLVHWDAVLRTNPGALALAVDDAHLRPEHPGWNGGWIAVNAATRTRLDILAAIRRGNFYSSCGPEIHSIAIEGDRLSLTTSPVQFMRLVGPQANGQRIGAFDGRTFTEATMRIPEGWQYAYAEIEDAHGRRAWTNSLVC